MSRLSNRIILLAVIVLLALAAAPARPESAIDVRSKGATGDGVTKDTAAIQAAIDAAAAGGGTVVFPAGRYLTGTIRLQSGVRLRLEAGAVIVGSTDLADYPAIEPRFRSNSDARISLIYAEDAENIGIEGEGAIDGQGKSFPVRQGRPRPNLIKFVACRGVLLKGVTLRDGAKWTVHFLGCDRVIAERVTINSDVNQNNDGFDIDSSSNVTIRGCTVKTGDDAIVLKSTSTQPCRNVLVQDCELSSRCNAFKLGTESIGGFRDIRAERLTITDTRLAGIALEVVDGGVMEVVRVTDVTMRRVGCPLFIRLGNRGNPAPGETGRRPVGTIRGIQIRRVTAEDSGHIGASIMGLSGHPVEDVIISQVKFTTSGGGRAWQPWSLLAEQPGHYPEFDIFGSLPAYGLFVRHARGILLEDMEVGYAADDPRPAVGFDDVERLVVRLLSAVVNPRARYAVGVRNVRAALFENCSVSGDPEVFVRAKGLRPVSVEVKNNAIGEQTRPLFAPIRID